MQFEREYRVGIRDLGRNNKLSNLGLLQYGKDISNLVPPEILELTKNK